MVAGGTGGHIYPAITLAEALKERGHDIVFLGSKDRMEKQLVPEAGFEYTAIDIKTPQGGIIEKVKSVISIFFGYFRARKLLKGFDLAVGFGNYITYPILLAAHHMGIKTAIHEQNSFAGKANRALDKTVDLVIGCYDENRKQFANPNTLILGNPQMDKALNVKKDKSVIEGFGLDPDKKTVVIFMGSLGSLSVNKIIKDYLNCLDGSYQVIYSTGKAYYEEMKDCTDKPYVRVVERIDGVKVMKNCSLLVCRAGATTLSEITAMGMPALIIPSPYVPNNHQYFNAKALVDKDAAVMIEEKQNISGAYLNKTISDLLNNEEKLLNMSENARKMANPNVLKDTIAALEKLC